MQANVRAPSSPLSSTHLLFPHPLGAHVRQEGRDRSWYLQVIQEF